MSIIEALILGLVQGITEFLPVSSSGHLVLLQKIFGITEPALLFNTAVHAGSLIAVLVVLREDIAKILRHIIQPMTFYIIIATIPLVIIALLFKDIIEEAFATAAFLGFAFLLTSALLLISGRLPRTTKNAPNLIDALCIGIMQAAAIIPGLSRSGATISAGLCRRLNRDFAARFSFLLSIPAILGAVVLQIKNLAEGTAAESGIGLLPILAGSFSSCVAAFFSVRLTIAIVRKHSLRGFAVYTAILGVLVLIDQHITHFFF